MSQYKSVRDCDWPLLSIVLAICGIGILQIYSATHEIPHFQDVWMRQVVWVAAGLVAFFIISSVDYHSLVDNSPVFYAVILAGLVAVLLIGRETFGSRRWIPMPGFDLQVSEFAKLVLVLLVARLVADLKSEHLEMRGLLWLLVLFAVPMALVARQPDLGTALSYVPILGMGVFLAGIRWQYYAAAALVVVLIAPVGWSLLKDYQRQRLSTFIDPARDPQGSGYQVIQSRIAIGSGEIWGKGVTRGSQTQLRFLPVPHNDFIIAAFAEEHGFVGVMVVLSLYFLLLMQIVQNAQTASDRAGMVLSMSVAGLLLFHILVNVGMSVGIMPVTGIPLPLMSYGGSSTISVFCMLGLVNNVRLQRFVN